MIMSAKERNTQLSRKIRELIESQGGNTDYNTKRLWEKSTYEISEELKQKNTNPSIDSYGEPNTF